jgi:Tfp pilus assembly protein PilN
MRAVNLLPRDEAVRSFGAKRGVVFGGVFGAALVTAALVSMTISAGGTVAVKQAELDAIRAEIAAVPAPVVKDTSTDDALAAVKSARVGALSAALTSRVAWDRVLRQVSLVLPEDVWLTNLSATAPKAGTPSADPSTSGVNLTGSTYSQNGVARFLSRLAVIPDIKNVRLQSSASLLVGERELVQFTILADVRGPGEAAKAPGS